VITLVDQGIGSCMSIFDSDDVGPLRWHRLNVRHSFAQNLGERAMSGLTPFIGLYVHSLWVFFIFPRRKPYL